MEIHKLYDRFTLCNGVSTDTRKLTENSMFFALKGDTFNGNEYVSKAFEGGAKFCVVDQDDAVVNENCILVGNVLETLQKLANYHRRTISIKIIGLTGSNGKTTTKELIYEVLATHFKVKATVGNLNNHIGVPLTLLSFTKDLNYGIVEMGANHQKEIEFLCSIAQPDYVVITNFGKAHLEGFGGVEGIIKGKSEIYDYARANNKVVFINTNDIIQKEQIKDYKKVVTFGRVSSNDYVVELVKTDPYISLRFDNTICKTQLMGSYNFQNIAIAAAIGSYFKVPKEKIKSGIESYVPSNNRSQIMRKGSNRIILDAYNANPTSMSAALKSFFLLEAESKYLFLGDMFELGEASQEEHQAIADEATQLFKNNIYLVGKNFYKVKDSSLLKFDTFKALKTHLKSVQITNADILIKASRGMALERILDYL